ncbi:hypothetical protein GXW83_00905 [Streptacidiphilus sp. PB12-B1b]|uniref:hypothetical protein n=1 Tax=Streptacidiphilus sp. PB12-B1b TaxID=2705012 RepID=UPI0015FCCFC0|nr:hypothetical protein [Streptacidiphilus sp. PB12-B1b]QMU74555.1 hypothetical protein GXW83_00905 [Streptacidiphilus sp. PB12-B1b]
MSSRQRRRTASAIALSAAVTTGAALLLTGCGPTSPATAAGSPSAAGTRSPSPVGTATAPAQAPTAHTPSATASAPAGTAPAAPLNGTGGSGLTISDGTDYVVMNGTRVDFGTVVRDLSWSPNGSRAAFIDGSGDLVVADPDGSGRVVVARNTGGQVWSHPVWQVTAYDSQYKFPARDNLFFAVSTGGVSRLESIAATAVDGTPAPLPLGQLAGLPDLPQTGNLWPGTGGPQGAAVYANSGNGEVYIRDDYLRQQGMARTSGSEPALAPDGEIVFVRSVGGHDHLFELDQDSSDGAARDLTPNAATDYTEPAVSADGSTVAARTPSGIVTLPVNGSAAPVLVSGYVGLPAYRA